MLRPYSVAAAALCVGLAACGVEGMDASSSGDTSATEGGDSDTDGPPGPPVAESACGVAPEVGSGRFIGTLRGATSDLGGACGLGGPDASLRVTAPGRVDVRIQAEGVGFVPRAALLLGDCDAEWSERGVVCTRGLEGWAHDVPAGTPMVVVIGADPDDPILPMAPSLTPDPLAFVVDIGMRAVLEPGDACGPPLSGRCATGTACLAPDAGAAVCVALEADTCASAAALDLDLAGGSFEVDPAVSQSDAHAHDCGGERMRERVLRLSLPDSIPANAALTIQADHPGVLLAVRGPGCATSDTLACGPAATLGAAVSVADADGLAQAGIAPYLFVELPDGVTADDPAITVSYGFQAP